MNVTSVSYSDWAHTTFYSLTSRIDGMPGLGKFIPKTKYIELPEETVEYMLGSNWHKAWNFSSFKSQSMCQSKNSWNYLVER